MESIIRLISQFAEHEDIIWGITDASDMAWIRRTLEVSNTPFVSKDTALRTSPRMVLSSCESVVVIGVGYGRRLVSEPDGKLRGIQTVLCATPDYHLRLKHTLQDLAMSIQVAYPKLEYALQVDTGPLAERELARRAGIGFYGRSHQLISYKFGTYFNIGLLLTNLYLPPSTPEALGYERCGSCRACISACPGSALRLDAPLNWHMCASYLTQKKGELSTEEEEIIGVHVYGCDTCQDVCPYNKRPMRSFPITHDTESMRPDLHAVLNMDKTAFKQRYDNNVAGWRGAAVLRRNASIAIKNLQGKLLE